MFRKRIISKLKGEPRQVVRLWEMEAEVRLVFNRAIEGIYTNCRKPVVQKEGINYCGAFSLALKTENILFLPSSIETRRSYCLFPQSLLFSRKAPKTEKANDHTDQFIKGWQTIGDRRQHVEREML